MEEKLVVSGRFKQITYILMAIGVISFVLGFLFDAKRTWANYLLNNYYFLMLALCFDVSGPGRSRCMPFQIPRSPYFDGLEISAPICEVAGHIAEIQGSAGATVQSPNHCRFDTGSA